MLIAHLSDLHLREGDDIAWLERQLTRIAVRNPLHLAVTGDLLDRWDPSLLERMLDAFAAHGFLDRERLTLIHGNHDLASSGGHPRRESDLRRLALRFWDPPPVVKTRRRAFHEAIQKRAPDLERVAPWTKTIAAGLRFAVIDTVPPLWRPFAYRGGAIVVSHGVGRVRDDHAEWLATQRAETPLVVLMHHYPLPAAQFTWTPDLSGTSVSWLKRFVRQVHVPMAIPERQRDHFWRSARAAGVRLVLCGHVHRARLEWNDGIAVGLNGQSGAEWAGRSVAFYQLGPTSVEMRLEQVG